MAGQFDAHSGHRNRLRQRVLSGGFEGLQPHEIIEFLLYYAIPRQDVNELAHALIRRFGSVQGVLDADPEELGAVKGVGRRTAEGLALVGEAAAASARLKPEDKPFLGRYLDVQRFALRRARAVSAPASAHLCLDMEGRLLYQRMLCPSLSWGEPETLRAALADVLAAKAQSAVVLLFVGARHAEPQAYDLARAQDYAYTLNAAGGSLLDVVLVGEAGTYSLRRAGQIPDFSESEGARMVCEDYLRSPSGPGESAPCKPPEASGSAAPVESISSGGSYERTCTV